MERQRARAAARAVIITHQRHAGREIERLAKPFQRPHGDEMPELVTPPGGRRDEAPEQATAQDKVFAPKAVRDIARKWRAAGINPHERGADQAKLHFIEAKFLFEFREDRENGL